MQSFRFPTKTFIVAEIGNNHEGDFSVAKAMLESAIESGADAVKFQTFDPSHYVSRTLDQARFERLSKFQLKHEQFLELSALATKKGSLFFSTPFDLESAKFLASFCSVLKISSGDNTFYPLIKKMAETKLPLILSTGMTSVVDVEKAVHLIQSIWKQHSYQGQLGLLHCVSNYPAIPSELNLNAIATLRDRFDFVVPGYSDHALGIDACLAAVGVGAKIIEKHFTLDKNYSDFRDHKLSADPNEFKEMVRRIREFEEMLGSGKKEPTASERANLHLIRRSIAAKTDLKMGTVLSLESLTWVRPGTGFPPGDEEKVIGRKLSRDLKQGDLITSEVL